MYSRNIPGLLAAFALVVAAIGSVSHPARGTLILRWDVETLARNADVVVRGRVEEVYADWTPERRGIYTHASVSVEETLAGARPGRRRVDVVQVGGRVGDVEMRIAGGADFEPGESVVLFLEARRDGAGQRVGEGYLVTGMFQGKLRLTGPAGERTAVRPARVPGARLVDPRDTRRTRPAPPEGRVEIPLDELEARIHEAKGVQP